MRKIAILAAVLVLCSATLYAAKSPVERRVIDPLVYRSLQYAFPDEHNIQFGAARDLPQQALGSASPSASPGAVIGDTWYEYQHNGSMGRMVHTEGGSGKEIAHFAWMYLPGAVLDAREYYYNAYNLTDEAFLGVTGLQSDDEYAGYVGIDVTGDGRAVVGGHNNEPADGFYDPHFYWDFSSGTGFFGFNSQVPDSVEEWGGYADQEPIWPKFRYVEGPGPNDTVLHVIGQVSEEDAGAPQAIYYFRRVGSDGVDDTLGTWDYPPYCIDTIYDISHDIAANDAGKTAIVWTANLPCPGDPDPLASGYECRQFIQWDNDIYYEISDDYGVNWNGRVNVTNNILTEGLQDGYRPYTDISALLDLAGNLHIVWGSMFWPADANQGGQAGVLRGRMFHWSENWPYLRTVHDYMWDQTECNGGAWQLNASKMSISECNGRLYVLFVQFNDIPGGVEDDCADEGNPGYPVGSANGDLWVVVSADGGLTWDQARNLTNTYTPGCDSATGVGGRCESDHWPSMTRYGRNVALNPGDTATEVIVPTGGADLGWYLDVQYISDPSAGGCIQDEGTWQQADVKWFRLACVEEIQNPLIAYQPTEIAFPAWTKHGTQKDTSVTLENLGNATLNYSIVEEEDDGPTGWLGTSGFSGSVPSGLNNTETGTLHLNQGGVVNNPGTDTELHGRVIFNSNAPTTPDTLPITFLVADTVWPPEIDTISSGCMSLAVMNNLSIGAQGGSNGRVNLDFVNCGDCDTNASIYLYDASPVIGWEDNGDTVVHWSIFGNTYVDSVGFVQVSNTDPAVVADGEMKAMEAVTKRPTPLGRPFGIRKEKIIVVVPNPTPPPDFYYIVIQIGEIPKRGDLKAGAPQDTLLLTIGEAIDWDIPSDSGTDNGSGYFEDWNLIYQYGAEYGQDDTTECQESDARFGGFMMLGMFDMVDSAYINDGVGRPFHGAYTADNPTYVYGNDNGFQQGELYAKMQDGGYALYSSANPDSTYTDLHTVMTYLNAYPVAGGDTLQFHTAYVVVENGDTTDLKNAAEVAYDYWCENYSPLASCCCKNRGNCDRLFDGEFPVTVADLTYLVAFLFSGGPAPPCEEEGNVDSLFDEEFPVTVADLTYLVAFLFSGGPAPPPCVNALGVIP